MPCKVGCDPLTFPHEQFVDHVFCADTEILGGLNNVHGQVSTNINQVQAAVGSVAQPIVASTHTVASQLASDVRNMGSTVLNGYKTLGNQMLGSLANVGATVGTAYDQLETVLNAYETQFCTPAKFTPSIKKPAKFSGPSFSLILSAGQCSFDDTALIGTSIFLFFSSPPPNTSPFHHPTTTENNEKKLNCIEPSITLIKTPANFTSKYHSAPTFRSKECLVNKTFGEEIQKVLYVFDGSSPVDLNSITSTVMSEIRSVTGAIGGAHQALAGQLSSFIGAIPHVGSGFKHIPGLNIA